MIYLKFKYLKYIYLMLIVFNVNMTDNFLNFFNDKLGHVK